MASRQAMCSLERGDSDWLYRFETLLSLHLPDLAGKTVLDVDSFDGYFSFAAERLGASRVLAVETHSWRTPAGKRQFDEMRRTLTSNVEDREMDVLELLPHVIGQFDVVLFVGVLQHTRPPLLALERIASVTKELLVMETLTNRAAVVGMLSSVGFKRVKPYPVKPLSATRLLGLPARARVTTELMCLTPWRSRPRLVRSLARSALTQRHLVTHSWR